MNKNSMVDEINKIFILLLDKEIIVDYIPAIIRDNEGDNTTSITWAGAPHSLFTILGGEFASIQEYRYLIQNRYFNGLLYDGSILQICCLFEGEILIKHRYWYYPSPILFSEIDEQKFKTSDDVLLYFDTYLEDEADQLNNCLSDLDFSGYKGALRASSPIRFDYDINIKKKGHPNSHLTTINRECRIPVYGPISIGHFIRFIFKNFYKKVWDRFPEFQKWNLSFGNRTVDVLDTYDLFIESITP